MWSTANEQFALRQSLPRRLYRRRWVGDACAGVHTGDGSVNVHVPHVLVCFLNHQFVAAVYNKWVIFNAVSPRLSVVVCFAHVSMW